MTAINTTHMLRKVDPPNTEPRPAGDPPAAARSRPIRVLMSLPDARARGGPPSHLYMLRDTLIEQGIDVRGFLYGGRTHDEGKISKVLGRLADLLMLPFRVLRHRPDIVQLNSAFDRKGVLRDVFFVPAARLLGRRVLLKFHGSDLDLLANPSAFWRRAASIVVRRASVVCVLSYEEADAFRSRFPSANVAVVKNTIDTIRYRRNSDFRARHNLPAGKPLLLFIARFIATKGLRETIEAMPAILKRHDVHAVFVGDGPVRRECEARCAQLGIGDHVSFTGYIPEDETVDAYLAADMLVFPTYHQEGMPMVIFHSLGCGLPIITTPIRAAVDWMTEGRHCLFVPPRDPEAIARAVVRLLDDAALRQQMGENGRQLARKFDRRAVAREFVALYESLITKGLFQIMWHGRLTRVFTGGTPVPQKGCETAPKKSADT